MGKLDKEKNLEISENIETDSMEPTTSMEAFPELHGQDALPDPPRPNDFSELVEAWFHKWFGYQPLDRATSSYHFIYKAKEDLKCLLNKET
jgi:hypothetical protein